MERRTQDFREHILLSTAGIPQSNVRHVSRSAQRKFCGSQVTRVLICGSDSILQNQKTA